MKADAPERTTGGPPVITAGTGEPPVVRSNDSWKRWLIAALAIAVACCISAALRHAGAEVRTRVTHANVGYLLLATGLCILYRIVNSTGWVFVLRALGHPMPLKQGARIWIMAETMRWLPGSVWGFCSRVYQAGKAGAPSAVAAASLPLELLLTIAAWAVTAATAVLASGLAFDWLALVSPRALFLGISIALLFAGGAALALAKLPDDRLPQKIKGLRDQLKELARTRPKVGLLAFTLALYTSLCALNGLAFYFVLRALSDVPLSVMAAIGANACGWLAGFFAVGVPGGIGVREASSAALLSGVIPIETVIAGALLWRLVLIADELCCLGVLLAPSAWKRLTERPRLASALVADLPGPQP
jgi:uncharacterized membrane protein YbhN (UPF0104 family)